MSIWILFSLFIKVRKGFNLYKENQQCGQKCIPCLRNIKNV